LELTFEITNLLKSSGVRWTEIGPLNVSTEHRLWDVGRTGDGTLS